MTKLKPVYANTRFLNLRKYKFSDASLLIFTGTNKNVYTNAFVRRTYIIYFFISPFTLLRACFITDSSITLLFSLTKLMLKLKITHKLLVKKCFIKKNFRHKHASYSCRAYFHEPY